MNRPPGAKATACPLCGWTYGTHAPDCAVVKNTAALDVTAGLISAAADAAFTGERAADADVIVPGLELTKREAAVIAIAIAESIVSIVLDAGGKVANLSKPDAERILASRSALSKLDAAVRRS